MRAPRTAPASSDLESRYAALADEIDAVLEGEDDRIARMATAAAMLATEFEHYFWTGFYLVDQSGDELVIGPYQGTLGCLRIKFGRGVCGAAARSGETQIVPDVAIFPDHIACDSRSRSEIVVPVRDGAGGLIGVLDVDSTEPGAFGAVDARGLEEIVRRTFARHKQLHKNDNQSA
jgi:GAF domain-containing protein